MAKYIRKKHGKGFSYKNEAGVTLTDKKTRQWIEQLAIPPAWTSVIVCTNTRKKVLAVGRDTAGRKQYIYNPSYRARMERQKFKRIIRFGRKLTTMRRTTAVHLRDKELTKRKVLACMTRLLDCAYFRPGNPHYTQENNTYGLLTLRSRHLTIKGDKLIFEYIGKSAKPQKKIVENKKLRKIVEELDNLPGYQIFQYLDGKQKKKIASHDLNAYIREVMGEEFSAKDFRTWAGTVITAQALTHMGCSSDARLQEKNVVEAVRKAAMQLGNTPSVARAHYIDPRIILHYEKGRTLEFVQQQLKIGPPESEFELSSAEEREVIALLEL